MKDDDMDDVFDSEDDGDEPELDIAAVPNRPLNWRRIELAKENGATPVYDYTIE